MLLSNETSVTSTTPPTFIIHSVDDKTVSVENSLLMYQALVKQKVKATLRIFSEGGHGYGLGRSNKDAPNWASLASSWLAKL